MILSEETKRNKSSMLVSFSINIYMYNMIFSEETQMFPAAY
jgi:hypothetical protein